LTIPEDTEIGIVSRSTKALFQPGDAFQQDAHRMVERGAALGQFGCGLKQMAVEGGLLPGQHIDVAVFEIAQELALDAALPRGEQALGNVRVIIRQLLQPTGGSEGGLHAVQHQR
jgi:hypothetical protein